jgi:hypothetical protein
MKPPRKRIVSWPELVIIGCILAIWIAFYAKPVGLLIVPEYVVAKDLLLACSMVIVCVIVVRQVWLWLRWWSVPISVVLFWLTALPASLIVRDRIALPQVPPSGEGFIYSRGIKCNTIARNTSRTASGDRHYELERSCGGRSATYLRQGESIFMSRLE